MNCKQVEELLPLYAGRDVEEKRATLVTDHLQTCAACARVADEYRESVRLSGQFAPPVFNEAVYAAIRQRVLGEIEAEAVAPAWSQTIPSLLRPGLTWAIISVLLIVMSMFAVYFIVNRGNDELAHKTPAKVEPGTKERSNSRPQDSKPAGLPPMNTGNQPMAGAPQHRRKSSRDTPADRMNNLIAKSPDAMSTANNVAPQPSSLPEPMVFPHHDSAASNKTLRMEIQTKDPKIRIIWFVQQETKPATSSSKGT